MSDRARRLVRGVGGRTRRTRGSVRAAERSFFLRSEYSPIQRYGVALFLSLLALIAWHLGIARVGLSPFFLYLAAVTVAAGIGGLGPGLLVIAFGVIASNFAYAIPGTFVLNWPRGVLQLSLFLFVSVAIALLQRERLHLMEAERASRLQAERLRAEQAAMMEQMTEAVIVGDPEGRVTYLNQAAREIYAAPLMDGIPVERMGEWLRVYRPDGKEVPAEEFALALVARGEAFTDLERTIERPDGSRVTIVANIRQVHGPDGRVLGAIATVRDVTHQRELERQRELLLSTIVHDLKSPLATIKGMAQLVHRRLVRTHEFPEELREDLVSGLERIDEKVSQMARLIDDVVESDRRHLESHFHKQDILPAIHSLCAAIDRSEEHHSIRVETSLAELVGEWDRYRLERAVENLVRNAVKYSPDGGTVRVRIERAGSDQPCEALITVEDQGIGVPELDQARIFERFYRAGNAAGVAAGTGIGLAAVRQAVESHGGTVVLESVEGQGTTVRVRLPLTRT